MLQFIRRLFAADPYAGKPSEGRSPQWPALRKKFLEGKSCAACGGTKDLEAHHVKAFHTTPELELVESNLIPLCEHPGHDCHFRYGHFFLWTDINPEVHEDAAEELHRINLHHADQNS